ncbi:MAG: type II toxin-antitoxin system VapC family toxin [Kiritimatiellae bacterium]|nr:type II toxin-antitoxin system VapC family toxin [Kiritimatiellia bacterium]MBP5321122.1 type II toxin-antitoxin system VapC family toxin [Kiritimatiellia bacterium]
MIFDTDVMIWAFRGDTKALDAIDAAPRRSVSAITYMELLQGARNKSEIRSIKRFLSTLGFVTHPVTANISARAIAIMELTALKNDLGVADALIAATSLETGDALLSGNVKHFKAVPLLDPIAFRPASPSRT